MRTRFVALALVMAAAGAAAGRAAALATKSVGEVVEVDPGGEVANGAEGAGKATFRLKFAAGAGVPARDDLVTLIQSLRWRVAGADAVVKWQVDRYTPIQGEAVVTCSQWVIGDATGFSGMAGVGSTAKADLAADALVEGVRKILTSDGVVTGENAVTRMKEVEGRLTDVRGMRGMLEAMARSQPSRQAVMAGHITALHAERERLAMTRSAKEARQKALEEAIAEERERLGKQKASDPIAEELRGVLKFREDEVKYMEAGVKNKLSSTTELGESREKLSDARIKLAEREGMVGRTGKGEILDRLADEMTMVAVDLTDVRLQLQAVEGELGRLNPAVATTRSLEEAVRDGTVPAGVMPPLYDELTKEERRLVREKLVLQVEAVEEAQ